MRNLFFWRLRPSDADFSNLWENATFVFDTNFLLDLYRVSPSTVQDFFKILKYLQNRIWLPYQVADEFFRRREEIIDLEAASFEKALSALDKWKSEQHKFKSLRGTLKNTGRIIDSELDDILENQKNKNYFDAVEDLEKAFREKINNLANAHFSFDADNDRILERLLSIFDSKVGDPYNEKTLHSLYKEAEDRFKKLKPPGFRDVKDKEDERKYGDFILWKQILDFAKTESLPIVFVTGEKKPDWWIKENGKIVAPHIELRREFNEYVKQPFWMYQTQDFLEIAKDKLKVEIDPISIEETNEIADADLINEEENEAIKEAIEQLIEQAKPEYSTLEMAKKLIEQTKPLFSTSDIAKLIEQTKPQFPTSDMAKLIEQTKPQFPTSDMAKLIEQTKPQFPTSDMAKLIEQMRPAFTNSDMEKLIEQMRPAFTNSDMEKLIEQMRKRYR